MRIILLTLMAFISGSLMFSYWLGLLAKKNLRATGDGNPGAFNLWRAAGFKYGLTGIVLDFLKGYLPVVIVIESGMVNGMAVVPIAVAPIFGHAFSPFLKFRGGKAIATTFGVWSALTRFEIAVVYAIVLAVQLMIARMINKGKPTSSDADGFQAVFGMFLVAFYLYARHFSNVMMWVWFINFLLIMFTNRKELYHVFDRLWHLKNS
ncbi:glycerol-3-phosphate acyltransferase [Camelliibacillus cellulosilyticus]|uniref:Glycerol-3-phosphate acyltransferase n=1 Tax=Camelliibacillus cellulosilyticus TaxID=2174486 RepID=A0ABV9GK19_9BACL